MRLGALVVLLALSGCECCTQDSQCQDGIACNGLEWCNGGTCAEGEPVVCDDGVGCTVDTCQEPDGSCLYTPDDTVCDDEAWCTGTETCDAVLGCRPGTAVNCADGVECTSDSCDDIADECLHLPDNSLCNNADFCDGDETCDPATGDPVTGCLPGIEIVCDDGIDCTGDACDEVLDTCTFLADDLVCQDDFFCTDNSCDPEYDPENPSGCVEVPHDCTDGIECTGDTCDDGLDACVPIPDDTLCEDWDDCNLGACDPSSGCGIVVAPDGTPCEIDIDLEGVCVGGTCVAHACGDGILAPDEECDFGLHILGCSEACTTFDFVVSDASPAGDDGREELGAADHSVAVLEGGDRFVVAWTRDEDADPDYADVLARVIDVNVGAASIDLMVAVGAMPQEKPVVASLPGGGFVVAWHGYDEAGTGDDVDVFFAPCSVTVIPGLGTSAPEVRVICGSSIRANTTVDQAQLNPSLAVSPADGNIIVAWEDWSPYGEGIEPWNLAGIRYRVFDLDGIPTADFATDRLANWNTDDVQAEPSVSVLASGDFIIAWSDASGAEPLSDGFEIRARLFDEFGEAASLGDFVVNVDRTSYEQYEPTTAPVEAPDPGFLVAWTSIEDDGRVTVRANYVSLDGVVTSGVEVPLPTSTDGDQYAASAAADLTDPAATVVSVIWTADPGLLPDDSATSVAGVRLAVDCAACGPSVLSASDALLNTTWFDVQEMPAAAFGSAGALALVWTDWSGADGSGGLNEVRARYLPHGWVLE